MSELKVRLTCKKRRRTKRSQELKRFLTHSLQRRQRMRHPPDLPGGFDKIWCREFNRAFPYDAGRARKLQDPPNPHQPHPLKQQNKHNNPTTINPPKPTPPPPEAKKKHPPRQKNPPPPAAPPPPTTRPHRTTKNSGPSAKALRIKEIPSRTRRKGRNECGTRLIFREDSTRCGVGIQGSRLPIRFD